MPASLDHPLHRLWSEGRASLNCWLGIPSALAAEATARQGWDTVTLDLQHGLLDYRAAVEMLGAIALTRAAPFVRLPSPDPLAVTRYLDAGALGVIYPMIEDAAGARAFVAGCRYAPRGNRSYEPTRAALLYGGEYAARANDAVIAFAMIETAGALKSLDGILGVEGLDG
jgi:4-hydroxy-2-oxoheptanedioate aldolase